MVAKVCKIFLNVAEFANIFVFVNIFLGFSCASLRGTSILNLTLFIPTYVALLYVIIFVLIPSGFFTGLIFFFFASITF
jgi:hypothetical protein